MHVLGTIELEPDAANRHGPHFETALDKLLHHVGNVRFGERAHIPEWLRGVATCQK